MNFSTEIVFGNFILDSIVLVFLLGIIIINFIFGSYSIFEIMTSDLFCMHNLIPPLIHAAKLS